MKVDNYAVAMNAQYFNLQMSATEAEMSTTTENFSNKESTEVDKVIVNTLDKHRATFELRNKLSKGILQNLSGETQRLRGDKVEINRTYAEVEGMHFQASAIVAADGKEFELAVDISLARSFMQTTTLTRDLVEKKMQDPLVISLSGEMPSLSNKTFLFDIDSDGTSEQISQLKSGSAFLALDKNNNHTIDNGNELFGTKSGDGFADLRAYDDDNNGWIDENDAIFSKLQVWQKGEGKDKLIAIGEVGIGAIFLGNIKTPFEVKSESNATLGEIKSSSIVLFENGKAGVISQVDLAVTAETKETLQNLDTINKSLSSFKLKNTYSFNEGKEGESSDDKMKILQDKIKALEKQLLKARESEKTAIQVEIGTLFSQMMAMLDVK